MAQFLRCVGKSTGVLLTRAFSAHGELVSLSQHKRPECAVSQVTLTSTVLRQVAHMKVNARAAVLSLVTERVAPPHLWLAALFAAVPLMEASPPAFTTADTHALLQRLQARLGPQTCISPPFLPANRGCSSQSGCC